MPQQHAANRPGGNRALEMHQQLQERLALREAQAQAQQQAAVAAPAPPAEDPRSFSQQKKLFSVVRLQASPKHASGLQPPLTSAAPCLRNRYLRHTGAPDHLMGL